MIQMLAPICFFTYKRLNETQQTIEALKKNYLANQTDLYIFADGSKNETDILKVNEVRKYIHTITGFKTINIIESPTNKGLANSIISGVSKIINQYGKAIVMEDDLVSSPNFLDFMNQALEFYNSDFKIFSISGYSMNLPSLSKHPKYFYLGYRAASWGWATWADRWNPIDWEVKDFTDFKWNFTKQIKFMRGGSDMPRMLKKQMNGKLDSWAIRWCYHQFKQNTLTVYPQKSKIICIGFGENATHTKYPKRFNTELDTGIRKEFLFEQYPELNPVLINEFKSRFSILNRLKEKLKNYSIIFFENVTTRNKRHFNEK